MFRLAKVLLTIAVIVLAMPCAAQAPAPTTTAFDGVYLGVARTTEGTRGGPSYRTVQGAPSGPRHYCMPDGVPAPLTIVNGAARTVYGVEAAQAEGSVSPQGVLVMRTRSGVKFEGRIDGKGAATGRFTGGCSYRFAWQKKGQ